jgi:hypothetical protein
MHVSLSNRLLKKKSLEIFNYSCVKFTWQLIAAPMPHPTRMTGLSGWDRLISLTRDAMLEIRYLKYALAFVPTL